MNTFYTIDIIEKTEEELNDIFIIDQDFKNGEKFYKSYKSEIIRLIKPIFSETNNFKLWHLEKYLNMLIEEPEYKNILNLIKFEIYKTTIILYHDDIKIIYNYETIKEHFNAINQQIIAKFTHPTLILKYYETKIDEFQIYDDFEPMHFKLDE